MPPVKKHFDLGGQEGPHQALEELSPLEEHHKADGDVQGHPEDEAEGLQCKEHGGVEAKITELWTLHEDE